MVADAMSAPESIPSSAARSWFSWLLGMISRASLASFTSRISRFVSMLGPALGFSGFGMSANADAAKRRVSDRTKANLFMIEVLRGEIGRIIHTNAYR